MEPEQFHLNRLLGDDTATGLRTENQTFGASKVYYDLVTKSSMQKAQAYEKVYSLFIALLFLVGKIRSKNIFVNDEGLSVML